MAVAGLSTLGIRLGYTAGETHKDVGAKYTWLTRVNNIGGVSLSTETIDASALEDIVERTIAGRESTGGSWAVTINLTPETITEWETLITAYEGLDEGEKLWFQVYSEGLGSSFFISAQPPLQIPMPESGQNELWTVEMTLAIEEYIGIDSTVDAPSEE